MSKKKNTPKKHKFKYVDPSEAAQPSTGTVSAASSSTQSTRQMATATTRDFSYVAGDIRRIGIMAIGLVGLEVVLYFVLLHTAAGAAIFQALHA